MRVAGAHSAPLRLHPFMLNRVDRLDELWSIYNRKIGNILSFCYFAFPIWQLISRSKPSIYFAIVRLSRARLKFSNFSVLPMKTWHFRLVFLFVHTSKSTGRSDKFADFWTGDCRMFSLGIPIFPNIVPRFG
ncbi:MAG: hypothetical protein ACHP7O_11845 [Burkholderiales bacterium]